MGFARLQRGIILWAGLAFFIYATAAVVVLDDMWAVEHMGVLANGALAVSAWVTIAIKRPFTLSYARAQTDPAAWNQPGFIRANFVITAVWAMTFTANTVLAWGKMVSFLLPAWGYDALSYTFLLGAAVFTTWYPNYLRRARHAPQQPS